MKLKDAIALLTNMTSTCGPDSLIPDVDAIKLGIEALKAVQISRVNVGYNPLALLIGETED